MKRDPREHERVSKIFLDSLALDPEERLPFIERTCAGDSGLRAEVLTLLEHDTDVPRFLETGLFDPTTTEGGEAPPARVGKFEIVEKLGEGGMGVVYRAVQERPIRRQVAVKLIKAGIATRAVIARFETERQALALMDHPSIARVIDAGVTEHGSPYFAMEYVGGEPITAYCDRVRMSIRNRLELFLAVCDGVRHAHQRAIVHRDLKPKNVLVVDSDSGPLPKIIDFGVAKALDRRLSGSDSITEHGVVIGTPEYMSPEQIGLGESRVDTRTDVYSLGVVLYELLTGRLPFDSDKLRRSSWDEICRTIRETEPLQPSVRVSSDLHMAVDAARARGLDAAELAGKLRRDLDWIVVKTLQKEPDRRYPSVAELAEDLRRHLGHLPVSAGPPGRLYRLGKLVRRHRASFAGATAVALVLLTSLTVVSRMAILNREQRARSNERALGLERELQMVRAVLDLGDPGLRGRLEAEVRRAETDPTADPLLKARLERNLAMLFTDYVGDTPKLLLRSALKVLRRELGEDDLETLQCKHLLGSIFLTERNLRLAIPLLAEVVESRGRILGRDHPATLRAGADLGRAYAIDGNLDNAESLLLRSVNGLAKAFGEDHPATLEAAAYLPDLYLRQGRLDDAQRVIEEMLPRGRGVFGPYDSWTKANEYNLGCIAARRGDSQRPLRHLRNAVDRGLICMGLNEQGGLVVGADAIVLDPDWASLRGDPEFEAIVGPHGYLRALEHAWVSAGERDRDGTLGALAKAVELGFSNAAWLDQEARYSFVRSDPEFVAILERIEGGSPSPAPSAPPRVPS